MSEGIYQNGGVEMAKCILCGKETGDQITMCRECAEDLGAELEPEDADVLEGAKCYGCGEPAIIKKHHYDLCFKCYVTDLVYNASAVASLKKQKAASA